MLAQSGISATEIKQYDKYAREAILLTSLFTSVANAKNKKGIVAALVLYLQAHHKESLFMYAFKSISGKTDFLTTADEIVTLTLCDSTATSSLTDDVPLDTQAGGEWIYSVTDTIRNWRAMRHTPMAANIHKFACACVSAGLCESNDLDFSIGKLKLFTPIVESANLTALDFADVLANTMCTFLEGAYRVYSTKNISAFFQFEGDIKDFDDLYIEVVELHGFSITGNLQTFKKMDENGFEQKVNECIAKAEALRKKFKPSTPEYKYIMAKTERLVTILSDFLQIRADGGMRLEPFALSLNGSSGVGKSSLSHLSIESILRYNNFSYTKEGTAIWADNDKFASNIRSYTSAIIFDDFCNTKSTFMDFAPHYRLLQVVNSQRFMAPMAEAYLKGKVQLNPRVALVTTNVKHIDAGVYSNEPGSILRRFYHVTVRVKPLFTTRNKIDSRKVFAVYGNVKNPDIWDIDVEVYDAPIGLEQRKYVHNEAFEYVKWDKKVLKNISVGEYLAWSQDASKEFFEAQKARLSMSKEEAVACKCGKYFCSEHVEPVDISAELESVIEGPDFSQEDSAMPDLVYPGNEPQPETGSETDSDGESIMSTSSPVSPEEELEAYDDGYDEADVGLLGMTDQQLRSTYPELFDETLLTQSGGPHMSVPQYLHAFFRDRSIDKYAHWSRVVYWYSKLKWSQLQSQLLNLSTRRMVLCDRIACALEPYSPFKYTVPMWLVHTCMFAWRADLIHSLLIGNTCIGVSTLVTYVKIHSWFMSEISLLIGLFMMYFYTMATSQYYTNLVRHELQTRYDYAAESVISWKGAYALVSVIGVTAIYSIWKRLYTQSDLNPTDAAEESNRRDNMWADVLPVENPYPEPSKTTTVVNLLNSMKSNSVGVVSEKGFTSLGFYVCSNFIILPRHYCSQLEDGDQLRIYRKMGDGVGASFREVYSWKHTAPILDTDYTICFTTAGGSMRDFRKFFPEKDEMPNPGVCKLMRREIQSSSYTVSSIRASNIQNVTTRDKKGVSYLFKGYKYSTDFETYEGMCMSPVVTDVKPTIIGFHSGGRKYVGAAGAITKAKVDSAIRDVLENTSSVFLTASSGALSTHMGYLKEGAYGKSMNLSKDIHYKSATRFLKPGSECQVIGSLPTRATPSSGVEPTIISDSVTEIMGVPQQWGKPKMKGEGCYPFQATLEHAAKPSLPLGSDMDAAVQSYWKKISEVFSRKDILAVRDLRPLSDLEAVNGIKGRKYIDRMKMSTSPGYPLTGKKSALLVDLPPLDDYPQSTFVREVWDEVELMKEDFILGSRTLAIWKACLKDEPTKRDKTKVRVFQSAPLALQILIRKYFLPIAALVQTFPLHFECAVGINCECDEWEELMEHVGEYENWFAGDYSKYDVRMPAHATMAAFKVLLNIAEQVGHYSEDDLVIMRAIASEVIYPCVNYNGDLIMFNGTNPSGQNLTVIINSIVNSLLMRCCAMSRSRDALQKFNAHTRMMTYGDDVIGTVSDEYGKEFDIKVYSEYLKTKDIVFTLPDKESKITPFMKREEVDFLKRKDFVNPEVGRVGILSETSIFKRLHSVVHTSELTPEHHAAVNIDSSLHDWFYHGREVYEMRSEQLRQVALSKNILHLCIGFKTYDERVQSWKAKYAPDPVA
jgi:hypothetical protein